MSGFVSFRFDTDFPNDARVRRLIQCQGGKAVTVYVLLLCNIHRQGYCTRWDSGLSSVLSSQTGYGRAYISEVVKSCVASGLFDSGTFRSYGVLTSKEIQTEYAETCKIMGRKLKIDEYRLIDDRRQETAAEMRERQDMLSQYHGVIPPPSALRPIKELAAECLASQAWIDSIRMTFRIDEDQVRNKLNGFEAHLVASGYGDRKTLFDFKRHFVNYLRKTNDYYGNRDCNSKYGANAHRPGNPAVAGRDGGVPGGATTPESYSSTL